MKVEKELQYLHQHQLCLHYLLQHLLSFLIISFDLHHVDIDQHQLLLGQFLLIQQEDLVIYELLK